MARPLNAEALDTIFRKARTYSTWLPKPVGPELLRQIYELSKLGPTSANMTPMRVVFVTSKEGKERLKPALMPVSGTTSELVTTMS